ncbi:uncharacterized protein LOC108674534 [Hyalella azteca]|uniref:Uncharacterized protein LOC108674534 n=1 Tax=Hyalella azteca TaxID=294128 RepID=A0A8B7NW28_HYAAZ|nr:uncharacterized protein LOC108674534 [Hyalella azteca]
MDSHPEASEVAHDYKEALADLNSSKPQITFLTMLADENKEHAAVIVSAIQEYAHSCPQVQKLPCLYLVDSIIKNVKEDYIKLFQLKVHHLFAHIFEKVDERTRRKMYELRQTWNDIFRKSTLYGLDVKVQALDPAWPVTAPTPSASVPSQSSRAKPSTIFVNPTLLKSRGLSASGAEVGALPKELDMELKKKLALEKKQAMATVEKPAEKQSSGISSSSSSSLSKPTAWPSEASEAFPPAVPDTAKASVRIDRKPTGSSSSSGSSSRSTDKSSSREHWLKSYKIKKKSTDSDASSSSQKPSSSSQKPSQSPLATLPEPRRPPQATPPVKPQRVPTPTLAPHASPATTAEKHAPSRDPRAQSHDPRASSQDPRASSQDSRASSQVPRASSQDSRASSQDSRASSQDPRASPHASPATTAEKHAPSRDPRAQSHDPRASSQDPRASSQDPRASSHCAIPAATSSRDPRLGTARPVERPSSMHAIHPLKSATARSSNSSRDPRVVGKSRNISSRSLSKEIAEEANQLFKPDVLTKVPTKIKIDLKVFDASKSKPQVPVTSNRDPRIMSRDPRLAPKDEIKPSEVATLPPSSSVPASSSTSEAPSKKEPSASATKDTSKMRDKSNDRREEIQRELKKVDRKEKQRVENRSSSPRSSNKVERSQSPTKHRESSAHRSKDGRSSSKSSTHEQKKRDSPNVGSLIKSNSFVDTNDSKTGPPKDSQKTSALKTSSTHVTPAEASNVSVQSDAGSSKSEDLKASITTTTTSGPGPNEESKPALSTDNKAIPDEPSTTSSAKDSFRNVDRSLSRHRQHLRKRATPSPEPMEISPPPEIFSKENQEKKKENPEDGTDSDESDHYEANKPNPLIYMDKKGDVDLRLMGACAPGKSLPPADTSAAGPEPDDDLFGSTDVDLRTQVLPAAFQEGAAVTAGGLSVAREDQDLRKPGPAVVKPDLPVNDVTKEAPDDPEILIVEHKTHPSNWAKFREKNPEFKQFQRSCSTPSLPDTSVPAMQHSLSRARAIKKSLFGDDDGQLLSNEAMLADSAGLKVIITQAEEQLRLGQISIAAYNNTLQQVLAVYERDKMRRAQARDRSCSPAPIRDHQAVSPHIRSPAEKSNLLPPPPLPPQLRGPLDKGRSPLPPPPRPDLDRGSYHRDLPPVDGSFRPDYYAHDEWTGEPDLPVVPEEVLRQVTRESETRKIDIDGYSRDIRTYGETAILLMDAFDPRTVAFEEGHCNIVFDGGEFVIPMNTNDDYKEFTIEGETHRVKLGVPTAELFLDGRGYQCFFGGKPITIHLAGRVRTIRLDGRPPSVTIGKETNRDFLLGKISLVVNANTKRMMPVYLDAKPQRITIDGKIHVLKFVNKFLTVNINTVNFPVSYGGLPTSVSVRQIRKYLSFSALPPDIIPGETTVIGMDCDVLIPNYPALTRSLYQTTGRLANKYNKGALQPPPTPPSSLAAFSKLPSTPQPPFPVAPEVPVTKTSIPMSAPPPFPTLSPSPKGAATEAKTSAVVPGAYITNEGPSQSPPPRSVTPRAVTPSPAPSSGLPSLDVSSLLQTLIKVGIIGKPNATEPPKDASSDAKESSVTSVSKATQDSSVTEVSSAKETSITPSIQVKKMEDLKAKPKKPVAIDVNDEDWLEPEEGAEPKPSSVAKMDSLFKSQQLRRRSSPLVAYLYRGMQCSSCGMRYPAEQTVHYSQHLDWHFRQNKREQESTKKANTRKMYIPLDDWMQYEEIEDVDERVPSMFENESGAGGAGLLRDTSRDEDEETEASVPVDSEEPGLGVCPVCRDTFSQFFQHHTDEWHYRNAVARDGANYHPSCYQDLVKDTQKEREENAKRAKEEAEEKERLEAQQKQENEMKDVKDDDKEVVVPADVSAQEEVSSNSEPVTTTAAAAAAAADLIGTSAGSGDGIVSAAVAASSAAPEADPAKTDLDPTKTVTDPAANVPAPVSLSTDPTVAAPDLPAPKDPAEPAIDSPVPDPAMPPTDSTTSPADCVAASTPASADAVAAPATPADAEGDSLQSANSSAQPKKKKKKKKKKPVVQMHVPAVRIKEEPLDAIEITQSGSFVDGVFVKQEKPDEPEIEEHPLDEGIEVMDQSAAEDEASMILDTTGDMSASRSTLLTSTIDGNVEENEAPDTNPATAPLPRIRLSGALGGLLAKATNKDIPADSAEKSAITVIGDDSNLATDGTSSPTSQEKTNDGKDSSTNANENGVAEDEGVEGVDSDDDIIEWDEFIPPPFTPDLKLHPRFENAQLDDQGIRRAGLEMSGLCSVM